MAIKKKKLKRPPRILKDSKGRRYIKVGTKKFILSKDITEKKLLSSKLLKSFISKQKKRKKVKRPPRQINEPIVEQVKSYKDDPNVTALQIQGLKGYNAALKKQIDEAGAKKDEELQQLVEYKTKTLKDKLKLAEQAADTDVDDFHNLGLDEGYDIAERDLIKKAIKLGLLPELRKTVKLKSKKSKSSILDLAKKYTKVKNIEAAKLVKEASDYKPAKLGDTKKYIKKQLSDARQDIEDNVLKQMMSKIDSKYSAKILKEHIHRLDPNFDPSEIVPKKELLDIFIRTDPNFRSDYEANIAKSLTDYENFLEHSLSDQGFGKNKGTKGLYNDQIDRVMFKHKEYLGTIPKDKITSLLSNIKPKSRGAFIMNLDKSNKPGSHWVSIYYDARPSGSQTVEYYDSFSEDPPKDILPDLKKIVDKLQSKNLLKFKVNRVLDQRSNSQSCGYLAMMFIKDRLAGRPFKEVTGYSDINHSEKRAMQLRNKLGFGYI